MSYAKTFTAQTKEEAIEQANKFVESKDEREQPTIWGCFERNGEWFVTVRWYGLD